jgi:hypothetical protein
MTFLRRLEDRTAAWLERRKRERLMDRFGGIQQCPWCRQIAQSAGGGWPFTMWEGNQFHDVALASCLTGGRVRPRDEGCSRIRMPLGRRSPAASYERPWCGRVGTRRPSSGAGEEGNGRRSCCVPKGTAEPAQPT